jgi:hypothetical protein
MDRTLDRFAAYALEHGNVPDKIIFQFLDEAGVDKACIPTRPDTEMPIDDQVPNRQRAIWVSHPTWREERRAQLAKKAQEAEEIKAAKEAKAAKKEAKKARTAEILARKQARAAENRTMACGRASCDERCLEQDETCGWKGCKKCPAADIIWFCPKAECQTERKAHQKVCKTRRTPLPAIQEDQ